MNKEILNLDAQVVFFPVRHHSPTAAVLVRELIKQVKPDAVLLEGPSDFNPHIDQLFLKHELPIAIYTYFRTDSSQKGAFYPFCVYSPEWVAAQTGHEVGARVAFIDMPWLQMASIEKRQHLYADREAAEDSYIAIACKRLGFSNYDELWDELVEAQEDVGLDQYMSRCHQICYQMRFSSSVIHDEDLVRESFMAEQIRQYLQAGNGRLVVVTGGYHSHALFSTLFEEDGGKSHLLSELGAPASSRLRTGAGDDQEADEHNESDGEEARCRQDAGGTKGNESDDCEDEGSELGAPASSRLRTGAGDDDGSDEHNESDGEEARCRQDAGGKKGNESDDCEDEGSELGAPASSRLRTDRGDDQGSNSGRIEVGISLTPYSYERLDGLSGYDAGMPSPGFYHRAFEDRLRASEEHGTAFGALGNTYRKLLFEASQSLRKRGQQISAADLIAIETAARALARLRGRQTVWRLDLIDAIMTAVVKDEIVSHIEHPMLTALHDALRGHARGKLAEGTALPALVHDVERLLKEMNLGVHALRLIDLDLTQALDLAKSRTLHQLVSLQIAGFKLVQPPDLKGNDDGEVLETWELSYSPNFFATCIEAAVYGSTLSDAAANRLLERSQKGVFNAEQAGAFLLSACYMGLDDLGHTIFSQLESIIRADQDFRSVTVCASQIFFLYQYDRILTNKPIDELAKLLRVAFDRSVWLLEFLGSAGNDMKNVEAIGSLVDIALECTQALNLDQDYLIEVFMRARVDSSQAPLMRGALTGALWSLGVSDAAQIGNEFQQFRDPMTLGDFLTGLFHRAREVLNRQPQLMRQLDEIVMAYAEDQFLEAVPAMRQAFSYFSPREKHRIASAILSAEDGDVDDVIGAVDTDLAKKIMVEARTNSVLKRFGIRGAKK